MNTQNNYRYTTKRVTEEDSTIESLRFELADFMSALSPNKVKILKGAINKLAGLENLQDEGRMLKIPFRVGEELFVITKRGAIINMELRFMYVNSIGVNRFYCDNRELGYKLNFKYSAINKTVFSSYDKALTFLNENPYVVEKAEELIKLKEED